MRFPELTRRALLGRAGHGLGAAALWSLLARDGAAGEPAQPALHHAALHHPAKAKRVIMLYMCGGPSHLDYLDPKPELVRQAGKPLPESLVKGEQVAQGDLRAGILPAQFPFQRFGKAGIELAGIFPHLGTVADELCVVRSMVTEAISHDPAHTFLSTGSVVPGRPSMGAWTWYGLGSGSDDLPGYVTMISNKGRNPQPLPARMWHSGFLPSRFQGVELRGGAEPVFDLANPPGVDAGRQRDVVEAAIALDRQHLARHDDPEIATRIAQYEMAFRMQSSVPALADLAKEPEAVRSRYGLERDTGGYARNCLLARRLVERGVRFIQLFHRDWDFHEDLVTHSNVAVPAVDQATAALIADLKERGLLDETLIVWGGEFGRSAHTQKGDGRDHHMRGFSMWLCGGGVKRGHVHGATDDFGFHAVQDVVHVHDLHATMLHLLGIDHRRLTVRSQGRDMRLTDVAGHVVKGILA